MIINTNDDDEFYSEEPVEIPIEPEIDLHTFHPKEVRELLEEYLYQCHLRGFTEVRIVHGKGQQVLRKIVNSVLDKNAYVMNYKPAPPESGGHGATIAYLKRD